MTSHTGTLQLKVTLRHISPPIWRRIVVPAAIDLPRLHDILQLTMGWTNSHLHMFRRGNEIWSPHLPGIEPLGEDTEGLLAGDLLTAPGDRLVYEYDFGDGWEHDLLVEAADPDATPILGCLDGRRACPPEDCGGPGGYADLLEALADPDHEGHRDMMAWTGGGFDPAKFEAAAIDAMLQTAPSADDEEDPFEPAVAAAHLQALLPEDPAAARIVADLQSDSHGVQQAAMVQALAFGPSLAPALTFLLLQAADPRTDGSAHVPVAFVLAQWRHTAARDALLLTLQGDGEDVETLWGDLITEDLAHLVAAMSDADIDVLRHLVIDPDVDEWARAALLHSLAILHHQGEVPRSAFVACLRQLVEQGLSDEPDALHFELANIAIDLRVTELHATLVAWRRNGLLTAREIGDDDLAELAAGAPPNGRDLDRRYGLVPDAVAAFARWDPDRPVPQPVRAPQALPKARQGAKVGRNDPCPCGSGRKWKKCCGRDQTGEAIPGTQSM